MRVLVLTNLYPNPFEANRAPFNRQQFRALNLIHPLRLISPISWMDELKARAGGTRGIPATRRVLHDGIVVDHPRYLYPPRLLRQWYGHFYQACVRPAFRRAVAEFRPDLVLGSWAYPDGWAAVRLAHEAGLPAVVKVHGCDVLWGLRNHPERQPRTRQALCRADGVVAVSRDLADEVIRFGARPDRVRVVYNGIDSAVFHPGSRADARMKLGLSQEARILLFVGSLVPVKGLDVLLDACARLRAAGEHFQCCVLGEGPLKAELVKRAADLGIADAVSFLGARPHAQLGDWYRAASVFVLPSRSEGVPGVLMEAISCGVPFVATQVGGTPEVAHLGDGQLVPSCDPASLAAALAKQLNRASEPDASPYLRGYGESARELADCLGEVLCRRPRGRRTQRTGVPRAATRPQTQDSLPGDRLLKG
jgi:glycosyltransferase involved in cell wall biosynthesis